MNHDSTLPHQPPHDLGVIYFVGIGGIGMSAIAEVLHNLGYQVAGSDAAENANVKKLKEKNIPIDIGHHADNIKNADRLVISTAIKPDNPEYQAAKKKKIPIAHRADMLATLMRLKKSIAVSGSHGKTTTTSLIAHLFIAGNLDPVVITGGILNNYQTNAKLGLGDWLIAEADESDGSFLVLPALVAVVTNIDPEHLDHYGDFSKVITAFGDFIKKVPLDGFAVACLDHPIVAGIINNITDRRIITYGEHPEAMVRISNIKLTAQGSEFDLTIKGLSRTLPEEEKIPNIKSPLYGHHNILNATAAIAIARTADIPMAEIRKNLMTFQGVKRRFTTTGIVNGKDIKNITIIDDYAHHPTEITATLESAKLKLTEHKNGRLLVVMEPHRYTRLYNLLMDFAASLQPADYLWISNVYEAGEKPIKAQHGDNLSDDLVMAIKNKNHQHVAKLSVPDDLASAIAPVVKSNDIVLCLGAGQASSWAYALPNQLKKLLS